jgi:dihydrodipicolinate synthase/N-acetylneuraminate lyase
MFFEYPAINNTLICYFNSIIIGYKTETTTLKLSSKGLQEHEDVTVSYGLSSVWTTAIICGATGGIILIGLLIVIITVKKGS